MTDLIPNDLSHLSDDEFNALCPHDGHAPGPEPLIPAAQAVLDAYKKARDGEYINGEWIQDEAGQVAAALLAAADQARRGPEHWEGSYPDEYDKGWNEAVDYFTTIANELLENH